MDSKIFAALEEAIEDVFNEHSEQARWFGYIHPNLFQQMTKAATLVFDASMDGQEYAEKEKD